MKKDDTPVVHCKYSKSEKSLSQLLEESFRLYLTRILASTGTHVVSCRR